MTYTDQEFKEALDFTDRAIKESEANMEDENKENWYEVVGVLVTRRIASILLQKIKDLELQLKENPNY